MATSCLTRDLKDRHHQRVVSPFLTLRSVIDSRYRNDRLEAEQVYRWITLSDERTAECKKVSLVPYSLCHLPCQPAVQALILWSKIKFHMLCTAWIPKDLRIMLLGFIREVEKTLKDGLVEYFGDCTSSEACILSYDDYCDFTLRCLDSSLSLR